MRLLLVLAALAVVGTGACSGEGPPVSDTIENVSLARVSLRVEGDDVRHLPPGRAPDTHAGRGRDISGGVLRTEASGRHV